MHGICVDSCYLTACQLSGLVFWGVASDMQLVSIMYNQKNLISCGKHYPPATEFRQLARIIHKKQIERGFSRIKRIFTDQELFIYSIFKLMVHLLNLIYKQ